MSHRQLTERYAIEYTSEWESMRRIEMKKLLLIITVTILLVSGCRENVTSGADFEALYNEQVELSDRLQEELGTAITAKDKQEEITDELQNKLEELVASNEKLLISLSDKKNTQGFEFEDASQFSDELENASTSLQSLVRFHSDKFKVVEIGSGYGEEFGYKVLDQYFQMELGEFLTEVSEVPVGSMDRFCGHIVTALYMEYQYEQISDEQYEEFIKSFNELATDESVDERYKQIVYEIMAHLYGNY